MAWTVIWKPLAKKTLAELWVAGPDRQAIANAADRMDQILRRDPLNQGESQEENTRVFFVRPLAILFEIDEGDCKVHVLDV